MDGAGRDGELIAGELQRAHAYWTAYRRDFCNFVAEYYLDGGGDRTLAAYRGNRCVYRMTVARIIEMYRLR